TTRLQTTRGVSAGLRRVGKVQDQLFSVRDFLGNESLQGKTVAEKIDLLCAIGRALDRAHSLGLVHGAVHERNIFRKAQGGRWLLTDFSLLPAATDHTDDQHAFGQLAYALFTAKTWSRTTPRTELVPGASELNEALWRALAVERKQRLTRID